MIAKLIVTKHTKVWYDADADSDQAMVKLITNCWKHVIVYVQLLLWILGC